MKELQQSTSQMHETINETIQFLKYFFEKYTEGEIVAKFDENDKASQN